MMAVASLLGVLGVGIRPMGNDGSTCLCPCVSYVGTHVVTRPYIMDLESTNGTLLNGEPIEPARYIELKVS